MWKSFVTAAFVIQMLMSVTQTMEAVSSCVSMRLPLSTVSVMMATSWMRMATTVLVGACITNLCVCHSVRVCVPVCVCLCVCVCVCVCVCL